MCSSARLPLSWHSIEDSLGALQQVEGGYSHACRGIITLPSGDKAFVKIGTDNNTKKWATREVMAYHILADHNYRHAPSLLSVSADDTGFAIEALHPESGWDWTDTWGKARLTATLKAMDDLSEIELNPLEQEYFRTNTINETQDGWQQMVANADTRRILTEKLKQVGREDITKRLDIAEAAKQSASFKFSQNTLVHNDVRADNCAWNSERKEVKLVDWNWAQLGDRRIDAGTLLVNVRKTGLDIPKDYTDRLDKDALHWLAGYWLNASVQPSPPGGSEKATLRDYQLSSGIVALDLLKVLAGR